MISVQFEDFDHAVQYTALREKAGGDGAIVTFTGLVRDFNVDGSVSKLVIEHYPGMTEKALENICAEAHKRWELGQVRLIHRVGTLLASEQIVFVGVSSKHRASAFQATEFIMDFLKNRAPLWKQEATKKGLEWVRAKASDQAALARWE